MRIVPYDLKYKNDFIEMNKAWISEMFEMEPEDERELGSIEPYIEKGGQIFFALDEKERVMACCMIAPREDGGLGDYEVCCPWNVHRYRRRERMSQGVHCLR